MLKVQRFEFMAIIKTSNSTREDMKEVPLLFASLSSSRKELDPEIMRCKSLKCTSESNTNALRADL